MTRLFVGILAARFAQPINGPMLTFIKEFGLALFVFTIGLQLGPGFFASLRSSGLRLNVMAGVLVLLRGLLTLTLGWLTSVEAAAVPGLFAGASTNTPALAPFPHPLTPGWRTLACHKCRNTYTLRLPSGGGGPFWASFVTTSPTTAKLADG